MGTSSSRPAAQDEEHVDTNNNRTQKKSDEFAPRTSRTLTGEGSDANETHVDTKNIMSFTSTASLPAAAPQMDVTQSEWHAEMLCGLFMRSNEQELISLEHKAALHETSPESNDQQDPASLFNSQPASLVGKDKSKQGIQCKQSTGGNIATEMHVPLNNSKNNIIPSDDVDQFLMNMLHLGQSVDSTAFSLIPESLRGITNKDDLDETNDDLDESSSIDFDDPLNIPSSWKRPDYARRSLHELEKLGDPNQGQGVSNDAKHTEMDAGQEQEEHSTTPKRSGQQKYETFHLLYNECSLTAMANWAMLDYSADTSSDNDHSGNKQEWDEYKKAQEKRRATSTSRYEVKIPLSMYHLCGVCGGFGHYEAECELLLGSGNCKKREREGGDNVEVEGHDASIPKKIKTGLQNDHPDNGMVLDDEKRNRIISSLSKEIHIQQRQLQLYEQCVSEKKEDNVDRTEDSDHVGAPKEELHASASSKTVAENQNDDDDDEDESYPGRSPACQICCSGLDDGEMLVCDGCDCYCHMKCLDPPLESIPEGDWFCSVCISYDSDASSIIDIEPCGDFLIEQRKRIVAEEEKNYSGVSLGHSKCPWTTALAVLPEQDPVIEDKSYFQMHLGREYGYLNKDFFHGELCWGKRYDEDLEQMEWWPAMVSDSETRRLKSSHKTTYSVIFFGVDEESDIYEAELLPYLPYYEDIGHKRLTYPRTSEGVNFRKALMLSVSTLGLKSLGQILKVARGGVQRIAGMNDTQRRLLPPGWKAPAGWESADVDKIDDIMILSKDGSSSTRHEAFVPSQAKRSGPRKQSPNKHESAGKRVNGSSNPDQNASDSYKMVAQFDVDEVVGGIVSWQNDIDAASNQSQIPSTHYGVVVSIDTTTESALVRAIPMLSELSAGKIDVLFNNGDELSIHVNSLGSSQWMPLSHIRFVSGKPASKDLFKFKRKLKSRMKREMKSYSKQCMTEAKRRERSMVELADPL